MDELNAKLFTGLFINLPITILAFSIFPFFFVRKVESIDEKEFRKKMIWNAVIVQAIFFLLNPQGANIIAAFIWYAVTFEMGLRYLKKHRKLTMNTTETSDVQPVPTFKAYSATLEIENPERKQETNTIVPNGVVPRFCQNCGATLKETDLFCGSCGMKINR